MRGIWWGKNADNGIGGHEVYSVYGASPHNFTDEGEIDNLSIKILVKQQIPGTTSWHVIDSLLSFINTDNGRILVTCLTCEYMSAVA